MKKIISCLLLGLICSFYPSDIFAENITTKGFTISPPFQEVIFDKDQTKASFFIEITNNGSLSKILGLSIVDFGSLDESGGVAFLGSKLSDWQKRYGLASWVSLEKDSVIIAPQSSEKINVMINNKDSLSPGGHYAGLMASLVNDEQSGKNTVGIKQVFTSLIFAKKIGGEKYDLFLNSADFNNFYALKIPDEMKLRFQNRGNVHVVPRGLITITDPLSRIVAKGVINEESSIIIPESFRMYPVMIRSDIPVFFPGRYTMEVSYRYDGVNDFSNEQFSFYYFGKFSTALGLIFVGVCILLFVKYLRGR